MVYADVGVAKPKPGTRSQAPTKPANEGAVTYSSVQH